MITIAICMDSHAATKKIAGMVKRYGTMRPKYEITAQPYASPYEVLAALERGQFHHVYVLDVTMPDMSGIELGRAIREHNSVCSLIYCASSPDYALDSFDVQAQNYLIKPIQEKKLFPALDQSAQHLSLNQINGIRVRSPGGQLFVPFYQITYIELVDRRMAFHLHGGQVYKSLVLRGSFEAALAPLLSDPRFLQPHKSFVVNMDYIRVQADFYIALEDGTTIPISSRKQSRTLHQYFAYLSAKEQ